MKWFENFRQDWIYETLEIFGFINREHLMKKFKISVAQASWDLALFQKNHPGIIAYNPSTKRYERRPLN